MKEYLNRIRNKGQTVSLHKQALYTLLLALLGIALGAFSKFLDTTAGNTLPFLLDYLDIRRGLIPNSDAIAWEDEMIEAQERAITYLSSLAISRRGVYRAVDRPPSSGENGWTFLKAEGKDCTPRWSCQV